MIRFLNEPSLFLFSAKDPTSIRAHEFPSQLVSWQTAEMPQLSLAQKVSSAGDVKTKIGSSFEGKVGALGTRPVRFEAVLSWGNHASLLNGHIDGHGR